MTLDTCMLTLAHEADFLALAARLILSRRFVRGPVPQTVVVFDDAAAKEGFCREYHAANLCRSIVALDLAAILGETAYTTVQREYFLPAPSALPRLGADRRAATECRHRTGGRQYQALKKFYGAINGPASCLQYWVSDAESFPFRPYNFSSLVRAHHVTATWYEDKLGCTWQHNLWGSAACNALVARRLDLRAHRDGPYPSKYAAQTAGVDQWWLYDRDVVQRAVDLVQTSGGQPFWRFWWEWGTSDATFYDQMARHFTSVAEQGGPPMPQTVLNLPDEIRKAFPGAHRACCACGAQKSSAKALSDSWRDSSGEPCRDLKHLWSYCMQKHESAQAIARFLVERLGMFGSWLEYQLVPLSIVNGHPGYSWCINNCFNNRTLSLLGRARGTPMAGMLQDPLIRAAFDENKLHG
jgi:hypothetical protein